MRGVSAAANIDPFEGMPTYSEKYQRKVRKTPKLDTRPYVLKLFPRELWSTLDPDHDVQDGTAVPSKKRKTLQFSTTQDSITLLEDAVVPSGSNTEDQSRPDRRIQSKAAGDSGKVEDEDDEELRHDDEDEPPDEEPDEDENYEEDEVEMGGDYDAEHYFNDGGEDDGEYYDGGGDDDGGVM
ncbi:MAG: hypothetical protein M1825_005113 [Sarcosagium campestre]|nr:MAG: hypothetical protein M1825_005113 [Sarcosagium campestre]